MCLLLVGSRLSSLQVLKQPAVMSCFLSCAIIFMMQAGCLASTICIECYEKVSKVGDVQCLNFAVLCWIAVACTVVDAGAVVTRTPASVVNKLPHEIKRCTQEQHGGADYFGMMNDDGREQVPLLLAQIHMYMVRQWLLPFVE